MKKVIALCAGLALLPAVVDAAAPWSLVGAGGFTVENPAQIMDRKRPSLDGMVKDSAGNIWISCSYESEEYVPNQGFFAHGSGVTVIKPGGATVNVDVKTLGYASGITKLVEGGDGAIYALLNYSNLEWTTYTQFQDYILRLELKPNDTIDVTEVYTPGPQGASVWLSPVVNKIGGMACGGDGNIYWTQNGVDSNWRYHFFWRYDVVSKVIEEAPNRNGAIAECPGETHRLLDLEYLGDDQFAVVGAYSGSTWQCNRITWTTPVQALAANYSNPTWGRKWNTANAYDPLRKKMWVGGRSESAYYEWTKDGAGGTVVDLGGNKALQFVSTGAKNEYYSNNGITAPSAQLTAAMRLRVDSYSTDTTLMWQYGSSSKTVDGKGLAVALKIISGRLKLVDLYPGGGPSELADLGAVNVGGWNELYLYIDTAAATCKATWNNSVVYNGAIGFQIGKNWKSWLEWGSSVGASATCTATYDWVSQCIGEAGPGEEVSKHWLYVDGSKVANNDPYFLGSHIMTRFDGNPANATIFDASGNIGAFNSYKVWHANGYDELNSAVPGRRNQGGYWISALAVNPEDGQAWLAYSAEPSYEYDAWDRVRTVPLSFTGTKPPLGDEGVPEAGSQVVSLLFDSGTVYALTCSPTTGEYHVYSRSVPLTGPAAISVAKNNSVGARFETDTPKIVTLSQDNAFYIEDDNRASGIKVIPVDGEPVGSVGQRAAVTGFTDVVNGEAVVYANSVTLSATGDTIEPLNTTVASIGGGDTGIQPMVMGGEGAAYDASGNPFQSSASVGLNNTGLLMRVTGKLRWLISTGLYEFVDDGSGYPVLLNYPSTTGGAEGSMITVTGVVTVYWNPDTKQGFKVLTPRDASDIVFP